MKKVIFYVIVVFTFRVASQNDSGKLLTELNPFLSKSYFSFNFGAVYYPFSDSYLKDGYYSEKKKKNVFSGRFLLGYKFKEDFAVQFGVMRPASWYEYINVNGASNTKSVWINLWSLSLKKDINLNRKLGIYGELGFGNLTRVGFSVDDDDVFSNAHYISLVTGAGFNYKLNNKWDLLLNALYLPKSKTYNQPYVFQSTIGLKYNLRQISKEEAKSRAADTEYFFPKRFIQLGYGTNAVGFFTNRFFSMNAKIGNFESFGIPIFWHGDAESAHTFSLTYQQTVYRSKKLFSLDWGVSVTAFQTELTKTNVFAFSVFPVIRFYVWRNKPFDFYVNYSIIGPTFLTKKNIDGLDTGPRLTYQDFMGVGAFVGKNRKTNIEIKIMHYSNGNLFTENAGVVVPLVFTIGRTL